MNKRWWMTSTLTLALAVLGGPSSGWAIDDDDDHRRGRNHHHHHGGFPKNFFSVTPDGISYGYNDGNFAFGVGPLFGGYGPAYGDPIIVDNYYGPTYSAPLIVNDPGVVYPAPNMVQPVPRGNNPSAVAPRPAWITTNEHATQFQQQAEAAFLAHEYQAAERAVTHAIVEDPDNGQLLLFASQTKFAVGNYPAALSLIERATTLLPESEWNYVVKNFRKIYNNADYVTQMDALTQHMKDQPNDFVAKILRGYHYYGLGHPDAAARDFNAALKIQPDDALAKKLLAVVSEAIPLPPPNNAAKANTENKSNERSVLQRN